MEKFAPHVAIIAIASSHRAALAAEPSRRRRAAADCRRDSELLGSQL
eukprot:COSAG06_NODE_4261_length_4422_cov_7.642609_3_plen_47_part_00